MSESKTSVEVHAWSCPDVGQALEPITYTIDYSSVGERDVLVKVQYCGICASDVSIFNMKIPVYPFPLVAGHEGVGEVIAVGSKVGKLAVGDKVGLGVYRDACEDCEFCNSGDDNLCAKKMLMFMFGNKGAFADHMVINSKFAYKIPDGIKTECAGPLMCAGLTTFSPFRVHNILPGESVGVVGIGGLGHLSIQFAKHWGCKVYAFSNGSGKEALAKELGAHEYVDMSKEGAFKSVARQVKYLMVTAGGSNLKWKPDLLSVMKPKGKIILMGISHDPLPFTSMDLIGAGAISICGSAAGSSQHANEMLQFAALHKIEPMCEVGPIKDINSMIDSVKQGKPRFRCVVKHDHKA